MKYVTINQDETSYSISGDQDISLMIPEEKINGFTIIYSQNGMKIQLYVQKINNKE
jgi:hypothetical protein